MPSLPWEPPWRDLPRGAIRSRGPTLDTNETWRLWNLSQAKIVYFTVSLTPGQYIQQGLSSFSILRINCLNYLWPEKSWVIKNPTTPCFFSIHGGPIGISLAVDWPIIFDSQVTSRNPPPGHVKVFCQKVGSLFGNIVYYSRVSCGI